MAFCYVACDSPDLQQGEIISDLFEFKLQLTERKTIDATKEKFIPVSHPYTIIVSQDCDLEQDYRARTGQIPDDKLVTHVLVCALFTQDEFRNRSRIGSDLWKRVRQNQDERYHYLIEATIRDTENNLPELIADFKTVFSLPTEFVYWLLSTEQATRRGALCSPYLEDFMHRLYSFLGRVATPEISGES